MRVSIILIILILLISNVKSQEKQIQGDTVFWYRWNKELSSKVGLQDFSTSKHDFDFRLWNNGQVIEIWKENDSIQGVLTNYIFWSKSKAGPLFEKNIIDSGTAATIYQIINNSGIIDLPTDKMINKWAQGLDGITYIIEHADNKNYWFKTYWTPSAQDSLNEALIVIDFIKKISDTLHLNGSYEKFENKLPHKGCYSSGGMSQKCYTSNWYGFGYCGSTRLPIGYSFYLNFAYIGNLKTDFGLIVSQQINNQNDCDFSSTFGKGGLIFKRHDKLKDFLIYHYRQRKLSFIEDNLKSQNHKAFYGLTINRKFDIAFGFDFFNQSGKKTGGLIYSTYWFSKPKISILGMTSIFDDQFDYKFGLTKSFNFRQKNLINGTSIGLYYEKFLDYKDLNISISMHL